jgi:hypothetical protein
MTRFLTILAALAALAVPAAALANINGRQANSIATAYPTTPGPTYSGDFQTQTETEYVSFNVQSGQSLHFVVRNTTANCSNPSSETPCPVFATLVTGGGQQVGGEGSSAGTGQVNAGRSDTIDWTFAQGGTYYVAVDSSGDFPTFTIAYSVRTVPVLQSLSVASPQHRTTVKALARLGRPATRLDARLLRGGKTLGHLVLRNLRAGRVKLAVKLNSPGRRLLGQRHSLALKLKVTATPATGRAISLTRSVTLKG